MSDYTDLIDRLRQRGNSVDPPIMLRDIAADAIEALTQERDEARNMSRHNYRCAVHEQLNASANGIKPTNDYPPKVDDEYAALMADNVALTRERDGAVKELEEGKAEAQRWYKHFEDDNEHIALALHDSATAGATLRARISVLEAGVRAVPKDTSQCEHHWFTEVVAKESDRWGVYFAPKYQSHLSFRHPEYTEVVMCIDCGISATAHALAAARAALEQEAPRD